MNTIITKSLRLWEEKMKSLGTLSVLGAFLIVPWLGAVGGDSVGFATAMLVAHYG